MPKLPSDFQRIVLASRPRGEVKPENFRLEQGTSETLKAGQVRIKNHYLSLDPYMRGRMHEGKSYATPQAIDDTMIGAAVGVVIESLHPQFACGDKVAGMLGWSEVSVADGTLLRKIMDDRLPLSAYLGVAGMPGMTAWYGLNHIIHAKAGETIVVSAASGAVGSVVGQLAKILECRVVGIAGSAEKCAYVKDELGFDACINYKSPDFAEELAAATPDGIDGIFENVGGAVFDASLARINPFGRVALCGMIAGYNGGPLPINNARVLLTMRVHLQGFIVTEHMELWPEGLACLNALLLDGKLKYKESIAQGLVSAPQALIGLLRGENFGKQLVKLI